MRSISGLFGPVVTLILVTGCAEKGGSGGPAGTSGATSGTTSATQGEAPRAAAQTGAGRAEMNEEYLEERMEKIGPGYEALRKTLQAGQMQDAANEAQQLAQWLGEVEKFWAYHKKQDAVKWAHEASTSASNAAGAATVGDSAKATAAANNLDGDCKQCHGKYREPDGQGGYRLKPGVIGSGKNDQL